MPARTRPSNPAAPYSRLRDVMAHTPRYAFMPQARLARDAGISKSAVSRLVLR